MRFRRLIRALKPPIAIAVVLGVGVSTIGLGGCRSSGAAVSGGGVATIAYGPPPITVGWQDGGVVRGGPHDGSTIWLRVIGTAGLTALAASDAKGKAIKAVGGAANAAADNPTNPCEGKHGSTKIGGFSLEGQGPPYLDCTVWNRISRMYNATMTRLGNDRVKTVLRCIQRILELGRTGPYEGGTLYELAMREGKASAVIVDAAGRITEANSNDWAECGAGA